MIFQNPHLDSVAEQIQDLDERYDSLYTSIKENANAAFKMRWLSGRIIYLNLDIIKKECGTVRSFAEKIGVQEAYLSNNKRAYEALKEYTGISDIDTEWFLVQKTLSNKNIKSTIFNLERLPKLLNDPESFNLSKQRSKDEVRLETLFEEIEEIRQRNETANNNRIVALADQTISYIKDLKPHLSADDPFKSNWKSRYYLDWVKTLGRDFITGKPAHQLDPHHTLSDGSSGGYGLKVSDIFTIPVTRETHDLIESGKIKLKKEDLQEALIKTMSLFIMTHFKGD